MFDNFGFSAPKIKCTCGKIMSFPNGWFPSSIICENCSKIISENDIREVIEFPNVNLNKTPEELKKELHEAIKKRDGVMKNEDM